MKKKYSISIGVIIFIGVAVISIIAAILLMGRFQKWFMPDYQSFYSFFNSLAGIKVGTIVELKDLGIEIGSVEEVFLNDHNKIEVHYRIEKIYLDRIREDSVAFLSTPLPLGIGPATIAISIGSQDERQIPRQRLIPSIDSYEGQALLELKRYRPDEVDPVSTILENVAKLTDKISDPYGDLSGILANVESITRQIEGGDGIQRLYNDDAFINKVMLMLSTVDNALKNVYTITNDGVEIANNVQHFISGATNTVDGILSQAQENVEVLLSEVHAKIMLLLQDITVMLRSVLTQTIINADPITQEVFQSISRSVSEILLMVEELTRTSAADITAITGESRVLVHNLTQSLDGVMSSLDSILRQVDELVGRLQNSPLIPGGPASTGRNTGYLQRDIRTD